jgi:hypothetical protein
VRAGAKLTHMSADDTATPAGHFDEGETIYYVHDKDGLPLSFHRSTQGAETALRVSANNGSWVWELVAAHWDSGWSPLPNWSSNVLVGRWRD